MKILLLALVWGVAVPAGAAPFVKNPNLVVTIVFDQFRSDYLSRFHDRFLAAGTTTHPGGFNFLLENSAYFPQAEYQLLQCMTGPGHSVIGSGSYPHATGLVLNYWIDRQSGQKTYCANPFQTGLSIQGFTGSNVSDEYKNSGYPSKVISIALKDRAAILMGGYQADRVFWWHSTEKKWITSDFYSLHSKVPHWADSLNEKTVKGQYDLATPDGYGLTLDMVEAAIKNEKLGQTKGQTDFLWVSFSNFDYAGHAHGANSKEMEHMTLAGDQAMARFLKILAQQIPGGLSSVTVGLTGDHGVGPAPKFMAGKRVQSGAIDFNAMIPQVEQKIKDELGASKRGPWIIGTSEFNVYLSPQAGSLDELKKARKVIKQFFETQEWAQGVFTADEYFEHRLPLSLPVHKIEKTYFPARSGDVVVIPKPFFVEADPRDSAAHFTPYPYDCQVPLILYGSSFQKGRFSMRIDPADYAVTLANILGTQSPVFSSGRVLNEIVRQR